MSITPSGHPDPATRKTPGVITSANATRLTGLIIANIEAGTSPFLRRWDVAPPAPFNPLTGKPYQGINALTLASAGYRDPRWLTFADAASRGWRIKAGERAAPIAFWKKSISEQSVTAQGRTVRTERAVSRPVLAMINVFNAEQIRGIEPWSAPTIDRARTCERVNAIIQACGARFEATDGPARYDQMSDTILMPRRESFDNEEAYLRTALRVVGQWTGHLSRLDRNDRFPQGTPEYALEELRIQLYSYLLASRLQFGHDPKDHAEIGVGWVEILKADPKEILVASRDALRMVDFVANLAPWVSLDSQLSPASRSKSPPLEVIKHHPGRDASERIMAADKALVVVDAKQEFKAALQAYGLIIEGDPIMDGRWHRVPVVRDKPKRSDQAGAYRGFLDGRPAGSIFNHYTNQSGTWKLSALPSNADRVKLAKTAAVTLKARADAVAAAYHHKATLAARYLSLLPLAVADHPYLVAKGIKPDPGLRQNRKGYLIVPLRNAAGEIRSFQRIGPGGMKGLMKGAEKSGNFYIIEGSTTSLEATAVVLVAEGYSTGRTVNQATGLPVVVGVDAGNLPAVASSLKAVLAGKQFVFVGEFDSNGIGAAKAQEAASLVGGTVVLPTFEPRQRAARRGTSRSDFNDLQRERGLAEVRAQLHDSIQASRAKAVELQVRAAGRSHSVGR